MPAAGWPGAPNRDTGPLVRGGGSGALLAVNTRECAGRRASSMRPLWVLNQRRVWGQHIAPASSAVRAWRHWRSKRSAPRPRIAPVAARRPASWRGRRAGAAGKGAGGCHPPSITRVRVRITGSPTLACAGLNCWRSTRLLATGWGGGLVHRDEEGRRPGGQQIPCVARRGRTGLVLGRQPPLESGGIRRDGARAPLACSSHFRVRRPGRPGLAGESQRSSPRRRMVKAGVMGSPRLGASRLAGSQRVSS